MDSKNSCLDHVLMDVVSSFVKVSAKSQGDLSYGENSQGSGQAAWRMPHQRNITSKMEWKAMRTLETLKGAKGTQVLVIATRVPFQVRSQLTTTCLYCNWVLPRTTLIAASATMRTHQLLRPDVELMERLELYGWHLSQRQSRRLWIGVALPQTEEVKAILQGEPIALRPLVVFLLRLVVRNILRVSWGRR